MDERVLNLTASRPGLGTGVAVVVMVGQGLTNYYRGNTTAVVINESATMNTRTGLRLGDLQLRILRILWQRGEASVAQVMDGLGRGTDLAYTTVATMLRKMEARDLVQHRVEGRTFIYQAQVREEQVSRKLTEHLLDRLFQGSLAGMVSHLLSTREISKKELAELERLIAERKRQS